MRKKIRENVEKIIEPSEHQLQSCVVAWCDLVGVPIFAIPNGGFANHRNRRAIIEMAKLKREGLKSGVPDLFVPIVMEPKGGLFLEMKTSKGTVSANQKDWIKRLKNQGYEVAVCRSLDDAIGTIKQYLGKTQ